MHTKFSLQNFVIRGNLRDKRGSLKDSIKIIYNNVVILMLLKRYFNCRVYIARNDVYRRLLKLSGVCLNWLGRATDSKRDSRQPTSDVSTSLKASAPTSN
jgi:hypothetical protein